MARNAERATATRARLIAAGRDLFAAHGFAGTATDAILARAGVQRGALYHHFADKAALFEAAATDIAREAAAAVAQAADGTASPLEALIEGAVAWIAFMLRPDARRVLLIDAPTVLGIESWTAIDNATGLPLLKEGLRAAADAGGIAVPGNPALFAELVNGALNGLALSLGHQDPPPPDWPDTVRLFLRRFAVG